MDAQTLNSFAQELRRRRRNIIAQVAHTQEEIDYLSAELESEWSDSAVEEDTKHLLSRLDVRETAAIREIDAALERIKEGTYERCANCGQALSIARLQARPTARLCPACAHELEPAGSESSFFPLTLPTLTLSPALLTGRLSKESRISQKDRSVRGYCRAFFYTVVVIPLTASTSIKSPPAKK